MDARSPSAPNTTVSIRAGWLIDGTGEAARRDVSLRLEGERVVRLDAAGDPAAPDTGRADRTQTNLAHCTILPALVDSHIHLFMSGSADPELRRRQLRQSYEEARGVMTRHLLAHFRHGVLAVRDGGDYGGYGLRFRAEVSGRFPPVTVRAPGKAWRAPGRYGSLIGRPPPAGRRLARALEHAVPASEPDRPDHVKVVQSGLNSLLRFGRETPPQFPPEELREAVQAAARLGLPVMIHANGRSPVRQAVEAGCRSVEHGFFMGRENLQRMADEPVVWVPTVFTMEAYAATLEPGSRQADTARRTLDHQLEQLARARALGVVTATGTDCGSLGVHHGEAIRQEIRLFMQAGYSLEEAIRSASVNGAALLGLDRDLGLIAPGRPATFVAVAAPPADLPAALDRVAAVYVRGTRVELDAHRDGRL